MEEQVGITHYPNGGNQVVIKGRKRITYNTGDIVWFKWRNQQYEVVAYDTHDGLTGIIELRA